MKKISLKLPNKKTLAIILASVFAVIAVTLSIVLPLTLGRKSIQSEVQLTQTAQSFINFVIRIKTPITLESEAEIEGGYILYEYLNESDKENETVKENKEILDGYKNDFDRLKEEKDEQDSKERQAVLRAQFESAVAALPAQDSLSADDRPSVDRALSLYDELTEESRNLPQIKQSYEKLMKADEAVAIIEYNERLLEISTAAEAFINGVNAIGEVTLDSIDDIEDLYYGYEEFSQEVKDFVGVPQAKEALDAAWEKYKILKDESDVAAFKALAAELSPISAVTLDSERSIIRAEAAYTEMSENAKAAEGVAQAYEAVLAARARYNELFAVAEQQRIEAFISAVNAIRTDTENVDITWYEELNNASVAYFALTYESQQLPEVEEAFERWDAAQIAFDKKGYTQIPMTDPRLLYSGDNPPHLVLQMEENMLKPLREFYGVSSSAAIGQYAIAWLNVYVDGEYAGKAELAFSELGHIIANSRLQEILKTLSATNAKVVSGAKFSFSIYFEDRAGEFIPSNKTAISENKTYTW